MICGGRVPGSSSGAGGGSESVGAEAGGFAGAAFSLLVSCEEGPALSLPLVVAFSAGGSISEEEEGGSAGSDEGGRGARNRGSGREGDEVVVGWGMRGMGKSL